MGSLSLSGDRKGALLAEPRRARRTHPHWMDLDRSGMNGAMMWF